MEACVVVCMVMCMEVGVVVCPSQINRLRVKNGTSRNSVKCAPGGAWMIERRYARKCGWRCEWWCAW